MWFKIFAICVFEILDKHGHVLSLNFNFSCFYKILSFFLKNKKNFKSPTIVLLSYHCAVTCAALHAPVHNIKCCAVVGAQLAGAATHVGALCSAWPQCTSALARQCTALLQSTPSPWVVAGHQIWHFPATFPFSFSKNKKIKKERRKNIKGKWNFLIFWKSQ